MTSIKPKIIFWGTSEFALPSMEALLHSGYQISAIITKPDEPAGRGQILTPPPVKIFANKYKIPIFQPEALEIEDWKSKVAETDLSVVVAYGKIIPRELLDIPQFGFLNIHPSLLPRWRGPSPIQHAILAGDTETGVTIMKIDELLDHGPIVVQQKLKNHQLSVINYQELHGVLAKLGAELLVETVPKYLAGEIVPIPQDDTKATFSKLLKKDDGRIDWKKPAVHIERMVRAFNPWPGAWTLWPASEKIFRVRIEDADATEKEPVSGSPGFTWQDSPEELLIKAGKGSIAVKKILLEGKKSLTPQELMRGYPQIMGTTFV